MLTHPIKQLGHADRSFTSIDFDVLAVGVSVATSQGGGRKVRGNRRLRWLAGGHRRHTCPVLLHLALATLLPWSLFGSRTTYGFARVCSRLSRCMSITSAHGRARFWLSVSQPEMKLQQSGNALSS